MTDVLASNDTLLEELEAQFNTPPTCTFRWKRVGAERCGARAHWILTTLCCGHVGYLCNQHHAKALHLRRSATSCPNCGTQVPVDELENHYMIEPLRA